jgi:hypothetical protein
MLPKRFIWLGERDDKSTHLVLKKDGVYPTSAISNAILIAWMRDGKLRFLEDAPGETIPADVMLEVQNATSKSTAEVPGLGKEK